MTGLPCTTGPGYPIETTEYFQLATAFCIEWAICLAVISRPEGSLTEFLWPVASALMCEPPTSITRTLMSLSSKGVRAPRFPNDKDHKNS